MPRLTVEIIDTRDGYDFIRSDGERFYLAPTNNGRAALYSGMREAQPPIIGIVEFDISVLDKREAAARWVVAYPDRP